MTPPKLAGSNIVVFDLETKVCPGKDGISWSDYHKMGISVGCMFDFRTLDFTAYMDDNMPELAKRILDADLVVGFNIAGFDLPLLAATLETMGIHDLLRMGMELPIYDMLVQSRVAMGWRQGDQWPRGLKLDNHLRATFGDKMLKTEDGADAPIFWEQRKLGKLVSYCLADVRRESALFRHVWEKETYITDAHGEHRVLKHPVAFTRHGGQENLL